MLSAEEKLAPELPEIAAVILVRLARCNPDVSIEIAEKGGVLPLVKLLAVGSPGAQQQAASVLAELALVGQNRDIIANAGGIEPIIQLLSSTCAGSPETAARVLATLHARSHGSRTLGPPAKTHSSLWGRGRRCI